MSKYKKFIIHLKNDEFIEVTARNIKEAIKGIEDQVFETFEQTEMELN